MRSSSRVTYRVYVRNPQGLVSHRTTTESESLAEAAFLDLCEDRGLWGLKLAVVLSRNCKQVRYARFDSVDLLGGPNGPDSKPTWAEILQAGGYLPNWPRLLFTRKSERAEADRLRANGENYIACVIDRNNQGITLRDGVSDFK